MQWLDFQLDQTQQQTFFIIIKFPIMWYGQTGDHQQEDLTKYDNRPNMKILKNYNHFVFWLLARCCRFLAVSLKFSKSSKLGPFIPQKSTTCVEIIFSSSKKCKNSPQIRIHCNKPLSILLLVVPFITFFSVNAYTSLGVLSIFP